MRRCSDKETAGPGSRILPGRGDRALDVHSFVNHDGDDDKGKSKSLIPEDMTII